VLKVIDQGADDTTNAVSIRAFFAKTAGVWRRRRRPRRLDHPDPAPDSRNAADRRSGAGLPGADPRTLALLEPRETETRKMHALEEYGLMHVKLYEDIARNGHIATTYAYPVKVEGRYVMDPSPTPKFDNPKMHRSARCSCSARARKADLRDPAAHRCGQPRFRGSSVRDPAVRATLRAVRRRTGLSRRGGAR
jgi:alpha-D-ribose 1-methylphosphonate 5-phosphate C-P lyase